MKLKSSGGRGSSGYLGKKLSPEVFYLGDFTSRRKKSPELWARSHLTLKMNITFFSHKLGAKYFYIQQFFQKKQYFPRKWQKPASGGQVPFEGKRASGDENEYTTFFVGNEVLNIFLSNNFLKEITFPRKYRKKFWGHEQFLREKVI